MSDADSDADRNGSDVLRKYDHALKEKRLAEKCAEPGQAPPCQTQEPTQAEHAGESDDTPGDLIIDETQGS